jgi:hypothetical protein
VQRSSPEIFSGFGKVPTLGIFDPLFVVIRINVRVLEAEPFVVNFPTANTCANKSIASVRNYVAITAAAAAEDSEKEEGKRV